MSSSNNPQQLLLINQQKEALQQEQLQLLLQRRQQQQQEQQQQIYQNQQEVSRLRAAPSVMSVHSCINEGSLSHSYSQPFLSGSSNRSTPHSSCDKLSGSLNALTTSEAAAFNRTALFEDDEPSVRSFHAQVTQSAHSKLPGVAGMTAAAAANDEAAAASENVNVVGTGVRIQVGGVAAVPRKKTLQQQVFCDCFVSAFLEFSLTNLFCINTIDSII